MMTPLWFQNLAAYSVQISLLVIAGTALPWMLHLKTPKAMYAYWRGLLGVCLLLPLIQPWKPIGTKPIEAMQPHTFRVQSFRVTNPENPDVESTRLQERGIVSPETGTSWGSMLQFSLGILGYVLMGGVVVRLLALLLGYWRLRRYRRSARLLLPLPKAVVEAQNATGVHPDIYISRETGSPVTFGLFRATVLLPEDFLDMKESHQVAIAAHEFLHVRHRDWLATLVEEIVRGLLWFEPAIWWLLDRIQLTHESVVDREVIKHTQTPKDYVQALLEVVTAEGRWEITPAPPFLTRRHLVQRAALILQDVSISRKRLAVSLATAMVLLTFVGGLVVRGFPMQIAVSAMTMRAQVPEVKRLEEGTGSISGRVTIEAGPASGVRVDLYSVVAGSSPIGDPLVSATTDSDGRYLLANLPPGRYRVTPIDSRYTLRRGPDLHSREQVLRLDEAERLEQINFELIKGGSIAGRVTEIDGRPLSSGQISLSYADEKDGPFPFMGASLDVKGNYTLLMLPPGRYLVSVGGYNSGGNQNPLDVEDRRPLTYYPNVTNPAQATIIALAEGAEVRGIDIVVGPAVKAFGVSGRVLDSKTGAPVPGLGVGIAVGNEYGVITSAISVSNNAAGEYQLQDLIPGRYAILAFSRGDLNYISDATPFEIVNQHLKGIDIKVRPGATISGQVVMEGMSDPTVLERLANVRISVRVELPEHEDRFREIGPLNLNSDRALRIQGLPAGRALLRLSPISPAQGEFSIQRVERDGAVQTGGIELKTGEQVTRVRLVLAHGTGALHGQVKVQGGELPAGTRLLVNARPMAPGAIGNLSQVEVDMRGSEFLFDNLLIGDYDIILLPLFPPTFYKDHPHRRFSRTQQSVKVSKGSKVEVAMVLDLRKD